jgi:LCP family protein required for cell wall assembly
MILVSYSHLSKQLSLLSVPRDLWITSLQTKINSVYHYGKFKEEGGGTRLVKSAVLETLGLPVHYVAVVDFNFFKKVIDTIGGIDVNVEHAFVDNKFPLPGQETALPIASRYETISFEKGPNHFNGDQALKFVRSRNADSEEGTDTARNQRQQLVIQSIKEKVFTKDFFMNSKNFESLYQVFKETIETDVTSDLYPSLARLLFDSRSKELNQIEIGMEKDKNDLVVLESPRPSYLYKNQWVLIAKDNNWKALKQYLQNRLDGKQ